MRILNRIVSAVLALVLLVGGVLVALEILFGFLGRERPLVLPWDDWYADARATAWSDPDLRLAFVLMIVAGVLLLLLQAWSRRPVAVAMAGHDGGTSADLDRRGLERWLSARLSKVDGVAGADVKVRKQGAVVDADTAGRETERVRDLLRVEAHNALDELDLASTMPVKVSVRSRRPSPS